ncbi:hypothetical protein BOTBODRAFT_609848 [Botryobasidium botryosum FD-172 SS1]|uniref:CFA20 domain-containing protein n=1 Tax=Botryobasidium botryosum (strain FD-172 SS1) TaxID=930990 RepID=A0A067LW85_BOTB1|nr:hypothetical protein BOTBODRAFT_609848 [Botryobasidium botryosum FD-172 SS1]
MFLSIVQPPLLTLFSSSSSHPLSLFSTHTDPSHPSDSLAVLLYDGTGLPASKPEQPSRERLELVQPPDSIKDGSCAHTVLQIQSPVLNKTYIRCPPANSVWNYKGGLGIKLPWVHIQVRDLARDWSFEIGVVDAAGREGKIRCSTFQKSPAIYPTSPPLLHLPLALPAQSPTSLTSWCTLSLHLPTLVPHFRTPSLVLPSPETALAPVPTQYSHTSYFKIYATCRLRRVWFSENGQTEDIRGAWEYGLYAAELKA